MSAQVEQWHVSTSECVFETDLETLKQWIAEGCVLPTDKVSKGNLNWIDAGRAPKLKAAFEGPRVPLGAGSTPVDAPQTEVAAARTKVAAAQADVVQRVDPVPEHAGSLQLADASLPANQVANDGPPRQGLLQPP